jgi:hypothetical protein
VWTIGLGNSTFQIPGERTPEAEAAHRKMGQQRLLPMHRRQKGKLRGPGGVKDGSSKYSNFEENIY